MIWRYHYFRKHPYIYISSISTLTIVIFVVRGSCQCFIQKNWIPKSWRGIQVDELPTEKTNKNLSIPWDEATSSIPFKETVTKTWGKPEKKQKKSHLLCTTFLSQRHPKENSLDEQKTRWKPRTRMFTRLSKMDQLEWNHCAFVSILVRCSK